MSDTGSSELLDVLTKRAPVLRELCDGPVDKRDLEGRVDASRATVDRAVRELAEHNLVERRDDGHAATVAGRLALERLDSFESTLGDLSDARTVLSPLPTDAAIDADAVAGGEALLAADPAPYRPLERFHDAVEDAQRYRGMLPALDDARHLRLLYEHVVTRGRPAELVVTPAVLGALREEFPRRLSAMAAGETFELYVAEELPPYALSLIEDHRGADTLAAVVVFGERGAVHGVVLNDARRAAGWAERRYDQIRSSAARRTDELTALAEDEGEADDGRSRDTADLLTERLERAGFVELGVSFFRDEPVADPTTAWRAGLSLAEVQTGYAVERRYERDADEQQGDGSEHDTDDVAQTMAEALVEDLAGGDDVAVVGPPGSGKSTVCKRVACEWYRQDRGAVLYREQGSGRPLVDGEAVVEAVVDADGHPLVVVEDAVRTEANAVLDAVETLSDRGDVSVLVDAREGEWTDPPGDREPPAALSVTTMPPLDATDVERLVERFEETVGETVDVPAERLWEAVSETAAGESSTGGAVAPGRIVLLLHRLATYADPLDDDRTSLESAAAGLYDDLAGDEVALSVCVLAGILNLAGMGVTPDALHALADSDAGGGPSHEAVEAAIDYLDGRVLFRQPEGGLRTVHESWSVALLDHVLSAEGAADAGERFGATVSALLSLADDTERRASIEAHLDDHPTVDAAEADPESWAAEVVEAVHAVGRERPNLAPLFGDGATSGIELPAATPEETVRQVPVWLGRMFLAGSHYEQAERAFERLPEDASFRGIERLLGLSQVASERGDHDRAVALAERAVSLVDGEDDPEHDAADAPTDRGTLRGRANLALGRALHERDEFEDAERHLQAALEQFEAVGDRRRKARILSHLGRIAMKTDDHDRALELHRRNLDLSRDIGDREGVADSHRAIGDVLWIQSRYEEARDHVQRSLEMRRELGDRGGEFDSLLLLGAIVKNLGDHERAVDYFEQCLDIARDLGLRPEAENALGNAGLTKARNGELDRAREDVAAALEIAEELGEPRSIAVRCNNLGLVAVRQGDHDAAREAFERGLDIASERDLQFRAVNSHNGLGHVARLRGRFADAREHHEEALAGAREIDNHRMIADATNKLGLVALDRRRLCRARDWFEDGLAAAEEIDHPHERTVSLRGLGATARRQGDLEAAEECIDEARRLCVDRGAAVVHGQVDLEAARLALDREDVDAARRRAADVHERFAEMGATHWASRARRLQGRVAAEADDADAAREHLEAALATFEELDAPHDVLETLSELVAVCQRRDDVAAAVRYEARAVEIAGDAPAAAVDVHGDWLDRQDADAD